MNALFVANTELNKNEGIYKKILAQAKGLKNVVGNGWLLTKNGHGTKVHDFQNETATICGTNILDKAKEIIREKKIGVVYVRHMLPSMKLILLLRWMKKKNVFIFYEIPTYPYYAEQFRTAIRKHRAIAKLTLDTIFWPFIYRYISKLVVIKSNSKAKTYEKMIEITNGADVDSIIPKQNSVSSKSKISMVAVGTIYPYHGYDRMLRGLKEYNSKEGRIPIEFHIVGQSKTIDDLKKQSDEFLLDNVFFHGVKSTSELNEMYSGFDIGVGSVALFRRNADIDTTIKVIEYYCRGVVVLTSGISPMDKYDKDYTIHVRNDDSPIDITEIVDEYNKISQDKLLKISEIGMEKFSWNSIMKELCVNL